MDYPWYEFVDGTTEIQQGERIENCPILIPPTNIGDEEDIEIEVSEYNVVILSQSCDLENDKIDIVLVAPYWTFDEIEKIKSEYTSKRNKNKFREGVMPGYHLLDKCDLDEFKSEHVIVDFKNIYGVDLKFLRDYAKDKKRIRLLPPYREHLSQAFARHFMRVGLPSGIPQFN